MATEELSAIKEKNQKERIGSDCKKAWNDELLKDIDSLEKEFNDIDKIIDEYKTAYPDLKCAIENIEKDHAKWKCDIESEIPETDEKGKLVKVAIKKIKDNINKLDNCVEALEGKSGCKEDNSICDKVDDEPVVNVECPELLVPSVKKSDDGDKGVVGKKAQTPPDSGTQKPSVEGLQYPPVPETPILPSPVKDFVSAENDYKCSVEFHQKKEKEFNDFKASMKNNDKTLKKLKDIHALIEKEKNKYKRYFYISELGIALEVTKEGDTKINSPEELKASLIRAWKLFFCAKKYLRKNEYVKCIVSKTLEARKKNFEDAKKSRDNDILEKIDEISK